MLTIYLLLNRPITSRNAAVYGKLRKQFDVRTCTRIIRPPGAVAGNGLCFCAVPFLLVGWLVGLGPKFLDNGSQPSLHGSPRNLHTSWVSGQALKPTFEKLSKNWRGKPQISPTASDMEAHNFETAQHVDKQIKMFCLPSMR